MSDYWTDFVSADPWFRPEAASIEEASTFLRGELAASSELASSGEIAFRDADDVSVFFSPQGEHQSRCPRCGAELSEDELSGWMNEDYDKESGFRLAPRAMACCGAEVALNMLTFEQPIAFARFGFSLMNPSWKFAETLESRRTVNEMARNLDWVRADENEWRARHARWSADVQAGEQRIAARLESILGCGIVIVYEHL